ncbi:hypothetical protein C8Q77DRAFT_1069485 [Trametes polyzona]|nr:hypothetical protein C8Q77DRAFT_1069485 [Trametes polyzona]
MNRTHQTDNTSYGEQNRTSESWEAPVGAQGLQSGAGQNASQRMPGELGDGDNFDRSRMVSDARGPHGPAVGTGPPSGADGGVFAAHGGQLGTDTGAPLGGLGDLNAAGAGRGGGPTMGAGAHHGLGRGDNFGSDGPNFVGGPGPALPQGGSGAAGAGTGAATAGLGRGRGGAGNADMSTGGQGTTQTGNPGMGDKFVGSMEKAAGRVSGNVNMVERGQMRKTGAGPQANDTTL